ncbi:hypothetical protein [Nocardioides sp. zg-1230]|uniref:hypothetical protein n=1 Tax=Nocardioides sp. zg-1230 TaxID=2736601 RepID=UPI0015547F2A|nr:hypothetical protein [Nocardioides sp. zg-1230]NPC42891.1 hypothetical protein [Nocardioides sp. zg-1230]
MNPIRLVTGALTLPAHAAAAVIGTSVGVATTGVRTTARIVGRVIEQASGAGPAPAAPWPGERTAPSPVDPVVGTSTTADVPADLAADLATPAPAPAPARKAPAKKAAAKKAAAKKAPAKKTPAKKAPSKQAAVLAPALGLSEDEVEAITDDGPVTPSGIPAAGEGVNPDTTETDLHQPGTEPLMDPATVKAAVSESEMMRRAADPDKG